MFYKYKVGWYCEFEDKDIDSEGIVFAPTFGEAAQYVATEYDNVFEVTIREIALDGDTHCIEKEEINYAFEHS